MICFLMSWFYLSMQDRINDSISDTWECDSLQNKGRNTQGKLGFEVRLKHPIVGFKEKDVCHTFFI